MPWFEICLVLVLALLTSVVATLGGLSGQILVSLFSRSKRKIVSDFIHAHGVGGATVEALSSSASPTARIGGSSDTY